MVSTYLTYNSVVSNLKRSTTRVAQQADIARNAAYYKDNIGSVKTIDQFLKNDRLYRYAMKAYGLEDMIYAKAFMKKVLESNPTDADSFANKLTDKRYRDFAAAFSFTSTDTAVAQSANQTDEMIGLYTSTVKKQVDAIAEDTGYYNAKIANVKTVNDLLNDDRLRSYVFQAFGIDEKNWSRDTVTKVLSSDPSDPGNYVTTVLAPQLDDLNARLADAQADRTDANARIADYMTQLAQTGADMADLRAKITAENSRLAKTNSAISSYNDAITLIGNYANLASAYEFSSDGTLPVGVSAQTAANRQSTNDLFVATKGAIYLAGEEDNQAISIKQFRAGLSSVKSVDSFVSTPSIFRFALKAVGLDPENVSVTTIKAVLESDPNDPKSFVRTLKDDRYVQLARAFNFDGKGKLTTPLVAQGSAEVTQVAKNYIIAKTKFAGATEAAGLRTQAEKDAAYYQDAIAGIDRLSDLLSDRKAVDILLVSNGLDPAKLTDAYLKKAFNSDLSDPKSFANTESDSRIAEIVASFNFDKDGDVARLAPVGPQKRDQLLETQNNYLQQNLETQQGDANQGVRLALYFQRKAGEITSAFDLLGDKALAEVFRTTFGLPDTFANMDIDRQAKVVEKYLKLKDLTDPAKLDKLLSRFTVMYDLKSNSPTTSPALVVLNGSGAGISQDTYLAIARLGGARLNG
jgi:hypothetical protein